MAEIRRLNRQSRVISYANATFSCLFRRVLLYNQPVPTSLHAAARIAFLALLAWILAPVPIAFAQNAISLENQLPGQPASEWDVSGAGDASIVGFFDAHLAAEVDRVDDSIGLDRQVVDLITTSLSEGVPLLTDVANRLAMSGRTLQRRLAVQGSSFQALVDESRRELARRA